MLRFIDNILNIYSPVHVTASDQREYGSIWKPIDGVIGLEEETSWISLESSQSWWRMEFPHRIAISRVLIYRPPFNGQYRMVKTAALTGFAVYVGDFDVGNGSRNAMCGKPWRAVFDTVITFHCTDILVGKYLYVAAADRPRAALYLSEVVVYGCEGDCACLVSSLCYLIVTCHDFFQSQTL